MNDEKNVSTEQQTTEEKTRVSREDEDPQRPESAQRPQAEGTSASDALTKARFRRADRLLKRREYRRVYTNGVRASGRWLIVFAVPSESRGRLGVTASRKVGGSVVRSRCKRRIRELYRLHRADMVPQAELVINARKGCENAPWNDLVTEFKSCLRRIRSQLERR